MTVLKHLSPVGDGSVFPFTLEGPGPDQTFDLANGEHETFTLDPGTYVIREALPEDWELLLIRCNPIYYVVGPVASAALRVELEPGESLTCIFTNHNSLIPPPHPPSLVEAPALSPTALSILFMALAAAGGLLLRSSI